MAYEHKPGTFSLFKNDKGDNDKRPERRGIVQLIDGTGFSQKMRKSLGSKRKELGADDIALIVQLYGEAAESDVSKTFKNSDFGYRTITVERPLRLNWALTPERLELALAAKPLAMLTDSERASLADRLAGRERSEPPTSDVKSFAKEVNAFLKDASVTLTTAQMKALLAGLSERDGTVSIVTDSKGNTVPDNDARDTENVPLSEDIHAYFAREVLPHVPDAWIDESKTKIGYEIPFARHFYKYVPPRPLEEIDADLNKLIREVSELLNEVEA